MEMEKRKFGNTEMNVSTLGFGGTEIGFEGTSADIVERLLSSALDAGLNVIDTAECYFHSEDLIGKAVSHRRGDYYLFSKCGHQSGLAGDDWDPKMLELSIDRSLKRLNTEYLDLIQLHSCSEEILRQGKVVEVLNRAKEAGKVRYIGYSGDREAALYAVHSGWFDVLQTSVNIADQQAIDLIIPEALKRGMGVIAKRPVANAAWRTGSKPKEDYHHGYWERLNKLKYSFLNEGMDSSIGIALRFTLSIPGVHTAIVGTTNPQRWAQNAKLLEQGRLSQGEFTSIRRRWAEAAGPDWEGLT